MCDSNNGEIDEKIFLKLWFLDIFLHIYYQQRDVIIDKRWRNWSATYSPTSDDVIVSTFTVYVRYRVLYVYADQVEASMI